MLQIILNIVNVTQHYQNILYETILFYNVSVIVLAGSNLLRNPHHISRYAKYDPKSDFLFVMPNLDQWSDGYKMGGSGIDKK